MPGVGGDKKEDEGLTREELQEQERLRYLGNIIIAFQYFLEMSSSMSSTTFEK